ncbi:MAG: CubicO group peptidase (beta-lactamase class C family), partial [Myxococcota bacterium]
MPQLLPLLVVVAKCAVRNQNALMQFQGHVEAGYEPVGEAFLQNFAKRGEVGAAVAVFHHGRPVVDIWAGLADKAAKKPWEENTLALLFSATKGMVATCCLMAAERGLLDLDGTIGSYWPEFGRGARKDITVRQLLNHRSGMIAIADELRIDDFYDREKLNGILESQEPVWNPGEFQGYHGVTYGPYVGELFFRAVGKTVGQFLASEVAGPLGADIFLGLPESEDPRVAHTITVGAGERILKALPYVLFNDVVERKLLKALANKASDTARAFGQPAELGTKGIDNFNLPK